MKLKLKVTLSKILEKVSEYSEHFFKSGTDLIVKNIGTNGVVQIHGDRGLIVLPMDLTSYAQEMDSSLTVSSSDNAWLVATIRAICKYYPEVHHTKFCGALTPNSVMYFEIYIYDNNIVQNYVPQYAFGTARHFDQGFHKFWINGYSFNLTSL